MASSQAGISPQRPVDIVFSICSGSIFAQEDKGPLEIASMKLEKLMIDCLGRLIVLIIVNGLQMFLEQQTNIFRNRAAAFLGVIEPD